MAGLRRTSRAQPTAGMPGWLTVTGLLRRAGVRGAYLHAASLGSVGLCIALWIRAKTIDQDERGNAERRALFVGLWPPLLWMMGDSLGQAE